MQMQSNSSYMNTKRTLWIALTTAMGILGQLVFAQEQSFDTPYIDIHVHVAGLGEGDSGAFISHDLRHGMKFPIYLRAFGVTLEEIHTHGDRYLIEKLSQQIAESKSVSKAVVLAMDGVIDEQGDLDRERTQIYVPNEYLITELPNYPNLLFGASINPMRHDALERLEYVAKEGAVLVKWIPNIMLFDPNDVRLIPFYRKMRELGLPLLSHTGNENAFGPADDTLGDPRKLQLPLDWGVTVIMAHVGVRGESEGVSYFDAATEMLPRYDNLYADISSLTQVNKLGFLGRALKKEGVPEKLLYGSDWPLQFSLLVSPLYQFGRISLADIIAVRKIKNTWDRDTELKRHLGVTEEIFKRGEKIIRLPDE